MDLDAPLRTPVQTALRSTLSELFWYLVMASAAWLVFYVVFRAAFHHRRVSRRSPTARQVRREVAHSLRSLALFGVVTLVVVCAARSGWTRLYYRLDDYGWTDHAEQKEAMDDFAARKGLMIFNLPTGQGLLLKPGS